MLHSDGEVLLHCTYFFLSSGLLEEEHTDSLYYVSVCILSIHHILVTVHVLTGFFSFGFLTIIGDLKLLPLSRIN